MIITQKDLPKRHKFDEYITPKPYIKAVIESFEGALSWELTSGSCRVLDPGAGTGNWGSVLSDELPRSVDYDYEIHGVELQGMEKPAGYDLWYNDSDFITWQPQYEYDIILGNPPFKYAEQFLDRAFELTSENGIILFLLRNQFSESKKRYTKYFSKSEKKPATISQSVRRIPWYYDQTGSKKTNDSAFAMYLWVKGEPISNTIFEWLDWEIDE